MRRYRSRQRPPYDDRTKFWVGRGAVGGNLQEIEALFKVNRMWTRSMVADKHLYLLLGCMVTSSTEFQQGVSNCTSKVSGTIFIHTYLLTYSMVQGPSWEANWFAASQEIPRISRNPKVHYRTHKRPPPVSILGQPNPVHIPTSHLLEIHPNIIHPSTPRSPQWSLSLRFPHQDPIHTLSLPIRATCPAHLILLDFITSQYWVRRFLYIQR